MASYNDSVAHEIITRHVEYVDHNQNRFQNLVWLFKPDFPKSNLDSCNHEKTWREIPHIQDGGMARELYMYMCMYIVHVERLNIYPWFAAADRKIRVLI